nr:uncharacterized protein LOC109150802 [Ipomoea trifida]
MEAESLKDFIKQWQKYAHMVKGLDDKSALTMFIKVLKVGKLFISLRMDMLDSYAEVIIRASRYKETEQAPKLKKVVGGRVGCKRLLRKLGNILWTSRSWIRRGITSNLVPKSM